MLCPLNIIEKAFNYCLLTHPVGAMFGGVELDKVYSQLLLNKLGVELAVYQLTQCVSASCQGMNAINGGVLSARK